MGTGNILVEGVNTFAGVFTRLREIAQEFIPYFIYISIGALGITLIWKALKRITNTTKRYTMKTMRDDYYDRRARRLYGYRGKEKRTYEDEKDRDDVYKYGR